MSAIMKPPDSILKDLALYLEEGEEVKKSILAASGILGRLGELWLVLTDRSVFFHTREYGKEPIIALIRRQDIKSILYVQSKRAYTLTFTPKSSPQNIITVSFLRSQREMLEDFCEDLTELIEFKLEDHPSPEINPKQPPITTVAGVVSPHSFETPLYPREPPLKAENPPTGVSETKLEHKLDVRIAKTTTAKAANNEEVEHERRPSETPKTQGIVGPDFKIAVAGALVALMVGFIWYRLFRAINDRI